jgi:transposase-like protein
MTDIQAETKKRNWKSLPGECKMIFTAFSRQQIIHRSKVWKQHWDIEEPTVVKCMAKDLRECLTYYDFPNEHWKSIRTTNALEHNFREVRRRTRPLGGTFVNPASADRIYHNLRTSKQQLEKSPGRFYTKLLTLPELVIYRLCSTGVRFVDCLMESIIEPCNRCPK